MIRRALSWLRERRRWFDDTGVTEDNADEYSADLHNTLYEPTQEYAIVTRRAPRVTRIVRRRCWSLPASPTESVPIFDELLAEIAEAARFADEFADLVVRTDLRPLEVAHSGR